jgi:hypothetical protein
LTGGPAQWVQMVRDLDDGAGIELAELCVGDLRAIGWLRATPGQALPVEGELRLWRADSAATEAMLFRLAHDADGRPRLNDGDVGGLARALSDWLAAAGAR